MWIYQSTLDNMYATIKRQAQLPPRLDFCSKDELQMIWDEIIWKLNMYDRLLRNGTLESEEETCIFRKMDELEAELEKIDYEWSRFAEPCDPSYSLEAGFDY